MSTCTKKFFCVAFGGASVVCPPGHTIEALKKGVDLGSDAIYVELRVTRDGEIVIGTSQQRLLNEEPVAVADKSLAEWRTATAETPSPIASLDEVLELAAKTRCGIFVDVRVPGIENALARKLRKSGIPGENILVVVAAESSRTILRSLDPRLNIAHRFNNAVPGKLEPGFLTGLDADAVVWPTEVLTKNVIQTLKKQNKAVYAYGVTLAAEMRTIKDEGEIDGIVTAWCDLLLTADKNVAVLDEAA